MSIGMCYANLARLTDAIRYLERAAEINPDSGRITRLLTNVKNVMGV
jgi:tetratricopeptide (TPR) repeat protein